MRASLIPHPFTQGLLVSPDNILHRSRGWVVKDCLVDFVCVNQTVAAEGAHPAWPSIAIVAWADPETVFQCTPPSRVCGIACRQALDTSLLPLALQLYQRVI